MSSTTLNSALPIAAAPGRYYRRFAPTERVMHAFLMLTFIGCALTGVPLLFADHTWAGTLVAFIGGFGAAALIHRICASIMLGQRFPAAQFLITGVLGPHSNAHGPNEFLHIAYAKQLTAAVATVVASLR